MTKIRSKIEELQSAINYKLFYNYKTQEERDIYQRMDQLLDIIKAIVGVKE